MALRPIAHAVREVKDSALERVMADFQQTVRELVDARNQIKAKDKLIEALRENVRLLTVRLEEAEADRDFYGDEYHYGGEFIG